MRSLVIALLLCNYLFAHKINLFITEDNNKLQIYSYFASGTPCKECKIVIKHKDKIVLKDSLNKEGKYNYTSSYDELNIVVDGSSGHLVEKNVKLAQISKKNIDELIKEQDEDDIAKIFLSLGLIALFFYLLKWFKSRAK